jgi:hypothetical protein
VLAVGLIAVPGVPALVNQLLPENDWDTARYAETLDVTSAEGTSVTLVPPSGWQVQDLGDRAVLRTDGSAVLVQIYDLDSRDPQAVAQRLIRSNRVGGINTTLDGGRVATADGALSGDTCVALTHNATGTCAYLSDGDVMVSVIALGGPDNPAPSITDVVAPLTKGES